MMEKKPSLHDDKAEDQIVPSPEVVKQVEEKISPALKNLSDSEKHRIAQDVVETTIQAVSYEYSGAIPPPNITGGWEKILPGSADRILAMTERELSASISRDSDIRARDDRFRHVTTFYGFVIILILFAAAFGSLYLNYPWATMAFLGVGVASMLASFFKFTNGMANSREVTEPSTKTAQPTLPAKKRKR